MDNLGILATNFIVKDGEKVASALSWRVSPVSSWRVSIVSGNWMKLVGPLQSLNNSCTKKDW